MLILALTLTLFWPKAYHQLTLAHNDYKILVDKLERPIDYSSNVLLKQQFLTNSNIFLQLYRAFGPDSLVCAFLARVFTT